MLCSTYTDFVTYSQNDFGWQYDFRGILDRVQAESHIAIFIYIIEVTQEIFEVMHEMVRREKAHLRQVCRYHAQHSLDNPYAQYECDVLHFLNDPCDTVEKRWQLTQLGDTFRMLSEKQIKRLIERYHHNKTIEEIAHLEGVTRGSVNESIQAALAKLRENCEVFA